MKVWLGEQRIDNCKSSRVETREEPIECGREPIESGRPLWGLLLRFEN